MSRHLTGFYYGKQEINAFHRWVEEELCAEILTVNPWQTFVSLELYNSLEKNSNKKDFIHRSPKIDPNFVTVQVTYVIKKEEK